MAFPMFFSHVFHPCCSDHFASWSTVGSGHQRDALWTWVQEFCPMPACSGPSMRSRPEPWNFFLLYHNVNICMYVYIYICLHILHILHILHTYTYIYIHIHTYTYIHTHTYTYIHTHTYIYIHIHTYTYIYIHIHTYTYIYIHIHTYTYIYIPAGCLSNSRFQRLQCSSLILYHKSQWFLHLSQSSISLKSTRVLFTGYVKNLSGTLFFLR